MKTQEEFLQEILDLKKANPEMEIHFCVSGDALDEYCWYDQKIERVEINPWWRKDDGRIETHADCIKETMEDILYDEVIDKEDLDKAVQAWYNKEVKNAICVYTSFA